MNKEKIKETLSPLFNCENNLSDEEFYDELQFLLETLNELNIIDNESYEQAEYKVSQIWGFEK